METVEVIEMAEEPKVEAEQVVKTVEQAEIMIAATEFAPTEAVAE